MHESLMKNNEFMIQKADKGNTVVLINRADYIFKMKLILKDTSNFEKTEIMRVKCSTFRYLSPK